MDAGLRGRRLAPRNPLRPPRRGGPRGRLPQGPAQPVERKNGWQLAETVGDPTPYALKHLPGCAVWDADRLRDDLRDDIVAHRGDPGAVLAIDEACFLKKGTHSVGVQR